MDNKKTNTNEITFRLILSTLLILSCNFSFSISFHNHENSLDSIVLVEIAPKTYQHVSFLKTEKWGYVPCNGMVVINKGEAIIIDSPVNDDSAEKLIDKVENELHCKITAVVVTHFHVDCLGGLAAFHKRSIPSYAQQKTIEIAKRDSLIIPNHSFGATHQLSVGKTNLSLYHFGEGHTRDNIVCYFSKTKTLFGGCLVKANGSGKGNLADANVKEWSTTVEKVNTALPKIKNVIPGHGKPGGKELLDYTIALFRK